MNFPHLEKFADLIKDLKYEYQSISPLSVADPGFPIGGVADPLGGAPTSDAYTFWQKHVKTKEIDPVGGGGGACWQHPLDPPMLVEGQT